MRKLIQTKGHGPRKKTIASSLTSAPTARAAGGPFLRPPASSGAGKAAASGG